MRSIGLSIPIPTTILIRISILVLLNILDYILTGFAITTGIAEEVNPLLASVSLEWMGIIKTAWVCFFIYYHWNHPKMIYLAMAIFSGVVGWNIVMIILGSL
ncbi:hypothetical protein LCGC14_0791270 [marine sediment metagenome]|uniref:DUF5658 domain-containing protein n=1 Tax=marine sediment metagenome TaxID=412755 RepID=A0A0F9PSM4_9ZZZZ